MTRRDPTRGAISPPKRPLTGSVNVPRQLHVPPSSPVQMPPSPLHLNLKQRLAQLSLAPSSPSSYSDTPTPQSPRAGKRLGKAFFSSPLGAKRDVPPEAVAVGEEEGEEEQIEEIISRMIFQAGVDFETRPMVVLNASALPDPQGVSYDLLLSRVLSYLNLYVEADYTVIFFAAGGRHAPGWSWVWRAYRGLGRKYRKNLKQLYIVHSSFFTKMLFSLAGAIISPKFFRKLTYLPTLSALAVYVPITQIDIPAAVYQENHKHESQITLPASASASASTSDYQETKIFGTLLEELMGFEGEKGGVPRVVRDAVGFLRERGMEEEGLFRRSPQSAVLRAAQEAYDRGHPISLLTFHNADPHLAAVLLKKYLRDLPNPVFPEEVYGAVRRCPRPGGEEEGEDMACIAYVRDTLLPELPGCVYILLSYVLHLMHDVSLRAASNRMDARNLAVVLCPNLVKGSSPKRDVMMCVVPGGEEMLGSQSKLQSHSNSQSQSQSQSLSNSQTISPPEGHTTLGAVIKLCIERYYEVFDEVRDRSEARRVRVGGDGVGGVDSEGSSVSEGSGQRGRKQGVREKERLDREEDEEEIDDTMLVMPIAPNHRSMNSIQQYVGGGAAPSAWAGGDNSAPGASTTNATRRSQYASASPAPNPTSTPSPPAQPPSAWAGTSTTSAKNNARSLYTSPSPHPTSGKSKAKAKSLISVEGGTQRGGRRGSIAVGRGTSRKASGAGVEAMGVTAEGFFVPPVPKLPGP